MRNTRLRYCLPLLVTCAAFSSTAQAQLDQVDPVKQQEIYYHEPIELDAAVTTNRADESRDGALNNGEADGRAEARTNAVTRTAFEAFGQLFELELERNDRLIAGLPRVDRDEIARNMVLYRGKLQGNDASWVRLTRSKTGYTGMIWDGAEAYIIDTSDAVAAALDTAPGGGEPYTLIYRLADMTLVEAQCALEPQAKPVHDYARLAQHLQDVVPQSLRAASERLNVAVVADRRFTQANGSGARSAVIARMNVVDGIFSDQVGVEINVSEVRTLSSDGSLTSFSAGTLLDQFQDFVSGSGFSNPGLSHLFTGRDMNGSTVGIAYLSALCSNSFGIGLSQVRDTGTAGALIVAHEMGHNFGAPHDNQSGSACASTSGNFLMNPFINGSDEFSQCSLGRIQPNVNAASCITPISNPPPPPPPPSGDVIFKAPFNSNNSGFNYYDGAFRRNAPTYASGARLARGGQASGALRVLLGGVNGADITNMSAGWVRWFDLRAAANVSVSLRYRLSQSADYESDEASEAWLSIDRRIVSNTANRYLARIVGNGGGGGARSTGWRTVDVDLGRLAAGRHRLAIGGFNNKKTQASEFTDIRIDEVVLTRN